MTFRCFRMPPDHQRALCRRDVLPAEAIARIFGATNPLPNLAHSWNAIAWGFLPPSTTFHS